MTKMMPVEKLEKAVRDSLTSHARPDALRIVRDIVLEHPEETNIAANLAWICEYLAQTIEAER